MATKLDPSMIPQSATPPPRQAAIPVRTRAYALIGQITIVCLIALALGAAVVLLGLYGASLFGWQITFTQMR